jgi:hypothetical protein
MPPATVAQVPAVSEEIITDINSGTRRYIREHHRVLWGVVFWMCATLSGAIAIYLGIGLMRGTLTINGSEVFAPICLLFIPLALFLYFRSVVMKLFLRQLAEAIGFSYVGAAPLESVSGAFFSRGHGQRISGVLSGTYKQHSARIYEYQYTEGYGKSSHTYAFTIFEMKYGATLPHVLINASSLFAPMSMEKVELEGNFDEIFSVYVDAGKQMEIREILQPDVMQDLIASFKGFSVEIDGETVYVIREQAITDRGAFLSLVALVDKLFDEIIPGLRAAAS